MSGHRGQSQGGFDFSDEDGSRLTAPAGGRHGLPFEETLAVRRPVWRTHIPDNPGEDFLIWRG